MSKINGNAITPPMMTRNRSRKRLDVGMPGGNNRADTKRFYQRAANIFSTARA